MTMEKFDFVQKLTMEKCDFAEKLIVKKCDFVIDKICYNCEHWYKNSKDRALNPKCPWRNSDVPKANDFCSRWEPKEEKE